MQFNHHPSVLEGPGTSYQFTWYTFDLHPYCIEKQMQLINLLLLLLLFAVDLSKAVLFSIPVSLDDKQLPPLEYLGGSDVADIVARFMVDNKISPEQSTVVALNNRLSQELHSRAKATVGKEELFRVPFTLGAETFELPIYEKMPVLLLASDFCVQRVKILDEYEVTVAECCDTVLKLTDELHDQLLSASKRE